MTYKALKDGGKDLGFGEELGELHKEADKHKLHLSHLKAHEPHFR